MNKQESPVEWLKDKLTYPASYTKELWLNFTDTTDLSDYFDDALKMEQEHLNKILTAFADYYASEGCSCCRDTDAHDEAEKVLALLLNPDHYEDGSGFNWWKHKSK